MLMLVGQQSMFGLTEECAELSATSPFFQLGINEIGIQKALLKWAQENQPEGTLHATCISTQ